MYGRRELCIVFAGLFSEQSSTFSEQSSTLDSRPYPGKSREKHAYEHCDG
jgi:hypothetical protein